ncbi:MAG: ROK family protein [Bacteroidales bacterium]|nr:ROK family protein [Bacteroidales bacterium]
MKEIVIGIDIGGTNTVFGIVDRVGNILSEQKLSTKGYKNVQKYVDELSSVIKKEFLLLNKEFALKGIGIGAPNGNFYKGTIEHAANLEWKGIIPIADLVKEQFDVPVLITNDANAGALGEKLYGGAKNMNDFIFITLGTGLGSGIVSNGKLIYGHDGFAGEIGHTIAVPDGRECGCGRKGCLETYASATGIVRTAKEILKQSSGNSLLRNIDLGELSSKLIYEKAKLGDELAKSVFDFTSEILGKSLADAVAYTSPEAVFLFGGLANAEDLLLKPVKDYMEKNLLSIYKNKVKILPSVLKNGQAALLGAAALIWTENYYKKTE